jgi:hypothetical protein
MAGGRYCPPLIHTSTRRFLSLPMGVSLLATGIASPKASTTSAATLVKSQRNPHVELLGFSDSQGSAESNLALSRDRAKEVADRLTAYGVTNGAYLVNGAGYPGWVDYFANRGQQCVGEYGISMRKDPN